MEKNSIITGFVLGAIVPVLGFMLVDFLAQQFLPDTMGDGIISRSKTFGIIAICFNLIPFEIAKRKYWDDTMRGLVFPTLIYVGFWVYKFYYVLFG